MDNLPTIGDHVHFAGNHVVGACNGVIENIRRAFQPGTRIALPVEEWIARVRPDALPSPWAYGSRQSVFEARVGELQTAPQPPQQATLPPAGGAA